MLEGQSPFFVSFFFSHSVSSWRLLLSHICQACNLFRFHMDGVHTPNIVEWNKKRKLQIDRLDSLRPKHKCWVRGFPSEHALIFNEELESERIHNLLVKGKTNDATALDDDRSSLPESGKDSNSFAVDTDTCMSINEEVKLEVDCTKTFPYVRPSTSFEKTGYGEEETCTNRTYDPSHLVDDMQALQNLEEHILGFGNNAKDGIDEQSIDKEFEDILYSNGVNPNMYVLSSGRWEVKQGIL